MTLAILYHTNSIVLSTFLFVGIILFYFLGLKIFQYKKKRTPTYEPTGIGPFEGAMLGLISLLLAFTFNKAATHYDSSREQIIHETNCIGTVLLRADLFEDSIRTIFRSDLKGYVATRTQYFEAGNDE